METHHTRLARLRDLWGDLDEAMLVALSPLDPAGQWPWLSTHPQVVAAWEALTRPERLADLEDWLAHFDGGAAMNVWAAETTRKAIAASRTRAAGDAS